MDSNNTNGVSSTDQPASTGSVMDVQTPQPSAAGSVMGGVAPTAAAPGPDATITPDTVEPVAAPATGPAAPPLDDNAGAPTIHNPMADAPAQAAPQPAKKKSKALVVIVALIVAIALGVAAYFAYAKSMNHDESAKKSDTTAAKTETVTAAKAADVDDTTSAIDKSLAAVNDAKDFAATDLADATLGL